MRLAQAKKPVVEDTPLDQMAAPLLRPHQVEAMEEETRRLDAGIRNSSRPYGGTVSVADTRRAMSRVKTQLDQQRPKKFASDEIDEAVKAEKILREKIQTGMPTDMEMRRNPPGAVGKHRTWEKRSKKAIQSWQNIRLRLQASGALPDETESRDVSNVETLRRHHDNRQLSMDGAQIRGNGNDYYFPNEIDPKNLMSDAERQAVDDETAAIMRVMRETAGLPPAERAKARKAGIAKLMGA